MEKIEKTDTGIKITHIPDEYETEAICTECNTIFEFISEPVGCPICMVGTIKIFKVAPRTVKHIAFLP